jgi:hypothetical protein
MPFLQGGVYQEAVSAVSDTNQQAYEVTGGFAIYGIEYKPGSDGYVTWFSNGKPTWTMNPSAIGRLTLNAPCQIIAMTVSLTIDT